MNHNDIYKWFELYFKTVKIAFELDKPTDKNSSLLTILKKIGGLKPSKAILTIQ